jgi:ribonuclease HII
MAKVAAGKNKEKDRQENLRLLLQYDRKHRFRGKSKKPQCYLVGTDEVGRGCFAGPVVAAAVMLPEIEEDSPLAQSLSELNDSKLLTVAQRERISTLIHKIAICAIAESSPQEINEINILQASLLAMRRAIYKLSALIPEELPVLVLVDGNRAVGGIDHLQTTVIQGDSTSAAIAAASVIAKVYRDALMADLALSHPEYQWQQNKGYGSRAHRQALRDLGMTAHHRTLFCQKALADRTADVEEYSEDLIMEAALL